MGDPTAKAYLASPAIVAASAIKGKISSATKHDITIPNSKINKNSKSNLQIDSVKLLNGFPEKISGEIIFCYQDNLNTDGIYPGKYTYIDDFANRSGAPGPIHANMCLETDVLVSFVCVCVCVDTCQILL